jgi:hypothetical protein
VPTPYPVFYKLISSLVYVLRVKLEVVILIEYEFAKRATLEGT